MRQKGKVREKFTEKHLHCMKRKSTERKRGEDNGGEKSVREGNENGSEKERDLSRKRARTERKMEQKNNH